MYPTKVNSMTEKCLKSTVSSPEAHVISSGKHKCFELQQAVTHEIAPCLTVDLPQG